MNLKNLATVVGDDIGLTRYVVDSDFRTGVQGWSKTDQTGPLDLYTQRNPDAVHYTPGGLNTMYGTDAAAIQGALDACVDFRGDKVIYTPGSYSVATALALDVAGLRLLGPPSRHPKAGRVTVTATVDAAYTITADDIEIGHHTIVPVTAQNFLDISSGSDRGHLHHLFYNAAGVAASTSTEFCTSAASIDWFVEQCRFYVDAAQGDAFTLTSSQRWVVQDCDFMVGLTTVAWASVFTYLTSALGNIIRRCYFRGAGGATAAVFTNIVTGVANINGQLMFTENFIDGTALATASGFETTFGTAADIEVAENYVTGDASGEAGTVVALA